TDGRRLYATGRSWLDSGTPADAARAREWLGRALEAFRAAEPGPASRAGEAESLYALAVAYGMGSELEMARSFGSQALDAFAALGDLRGLASAHDHLGGLLASAGDTEPARLHLEEALRLRRQSGNRAAVAASLHNLASLRFETGDGDIALRLGAESLELHRALADRAAMAAGENNLGLMWIYLGRHPIGRRHLEAALALHRQLGDRRGQASTLANLGLLASDEGDGPRARQRLEEALELYRQLDDPRGTAEALGNLGWVDLEHGRLEEARSRLEPAIALAKKHGLRRAEGTHTSSLGRLLAEEGRWREAETTLMRAAELQASVRDPWGRGATLLELARLHRQRNRPERALHFADAALSLVESTRAHLELGMLRTGDLRAHFLASRRHLYDFRIDLLMTLGRQGEALLAAEQARARSLLDLLRLAGSAATDAATGALENEDPLDSRARLEQLRGLLDGETTVVAYHLGGERAWGWTLDAEGLRGFSLGETRRLETLAETAYGHLARSRERVHRGPAGVAARRLAEAVLAPLGIGSDPRQPGSAVSRRLAVVPDGALHRLPFAALSVAAGGPLVDAHELVVLPSLAVLAELRGRASARTDGELDRPARATPGERQLAVLADPVFSAEDPRLGPGGSAAVPENPAETGEVVLTMPVLDFTASTTTGSADPSTPDGDPSTGSRAAADGMAHLPRPHWLRLPHSGTEAERLARRFPAGSVRVATGLEASRELLLGGELDSYRRLHLATHTRIDDAQPELSGLALSMVDAEGRPRDGMVRLGDLFRLRLGAELVTLSACRSALGPRLGGEGLIGLSRGFFYAGAR
ncbi:MAG: CHAT domain-containing protein, partial [Holophagales bacterium]|nr:CHAT domain-containing protein [Holophagales bacterium]